MVEDKSYKKKETPPEDKFKEIEQEYTEMEEEFRGA